jgi:hypothetical protein
MSQQEWKDVRVRSGAVGGQLGAFRGKRAVPTFVPTLDHKP